MPVLAVPIKHSQEPAAFNAGKLLLDNVGILVSLLGVRDEALSSLASIL